ncbi:MAG: class I SAM-dependent methyltransferase [Anaerolineaceae bacterium]
MYDKLASVYDYFVNWEARLGYETPFILNQLGKLGSHPAEIKVMDTACGTGQHAIAIASAGYQVSGSDLFPQMVAIADENARKAGQKVSFKVAGFGNISQIFGSSEKFDAVLCLGNSLPHVQSSQELHAALKDFSDLLKPGGKLLLQSRNFDQILLSKRRWMEPQTYQNSDREWLFFRFYDFEPSGLIQFNILTLNRQKGKAWQVSLNSTHLLPLLSTELEKALSQNGFSQLQMYGNMKGDPYDPRTSGDLIMLAGKA